MTDAPPDADREGGPHRQVVTGRDVAGAGALMLSANLLCAGVGAGIGALAGAIVPLAVAGFLIGFFVGVYVVVKRFREL
ncbi:MAG TPA: hypothetical protein VGF70_01365 [Solirubrobacteraceae bacterium]|jgi:F0F1-type ATP synthase assembly protein I